MRRVFRGGASERERTFAVRMSTRVRRSICEARARQIGEQSVRARRR